MIVPGTVLGFVVQSLIMVWGGFGGSRSIEIAVVALLVSVPQCLFVIVASALFFGIRSITLDNIGYFWIAVLVVSLVLTTINYLAGTSDRAVTSPLYVRGSDGEFPAEMITACADNQPDVPALMPLPAVQELSDGGIRSVAPVLPLIPALLAEKLPTRLRSGRLIAVAAEDHYLRIHTDCGSDLALMRMSDACALLVDVAGARVHRSWWVARGAVEGQTRERSRVELTVRGGLTVPVSRAQYTAMRDTAWGYNSKAI